MWLIISKECKLQKIPSSDKEDQDRVLDINVLNMAWFGIKWSIPVGIALDNDIKSPEF